MMTTSHAPVRQRLQNLARSANNLLPHDADDPAVDRVAAFIAVAIFLDFATTTLIFVDPGLAEANEFLSTLATIHGAIALGC